MKTGMNGRDQSLWQHEQRITEFLGRGDARAVELALDVLGPRTLAALRGRFGRLLDEADFEDAIATALAQLWFERGRYDPHKARVATWFLVLARNAAIDLLRRRPAETAQLDDSIASSARTSSTVDEDPAAQERRKRLSRQLHEGLQELSPREREILKVAADARPGAEWAREVAARLKISPAHARVLRFRAARKLRRHLAERLSDYRTGDGHGTQHE